MFFVLELSFLFVFGWGEGSLFSRQTLEWPVFGCVQLDCGWNPHPRVDTDLSNDNSNGTSNSTPSRVAPKRSPQSDRCFGRRNDLCAFL